MKKYLFLIVVLLVSLPVFTAQEPKIISVAFLGIKAGNEIEFLKKFEDALYDKLMYLPNTTLLDKQFLNRVKEKGLLKTPYISQEQAEQIAFSFQCRTLVYARIDKAEIKPKRYWFFPIWGFYKCNLTLELFLFDIEKHNFRFNEKIIVSFDKYKGYCSIEKFNNFMTLSAEERSTIQNTWISMAKDEIFNKIKLNLTGFNMQKEFDSIEQIPSDSLLIPKQGKDSTGLKFFLDSALQIKDSTKIKTDSTKLNADLTKAKTDSTNNKNSTKK